MKKAQKILGLPIISISDGLEAGIVKSVIINAEKGAIDYFIVDNGIQIFNARVIDVQDVLGIGEYALTIENGGAISDIGRLPAAIQLLQNDVAVSGTKVMTRRGRLVGEIGDIYVDENKSCRITGLEFIADQNQRQVRIIPRDSVITFGKKLTVVKDDFEASLMDTPAGLESDEGFTGFGYRDSEISGMSFAAGSADNGAFAGFEYHSSAVADNASEFRSGGESAADRNTDNASVLFEQRQRQYLKGRYASKTIIDNDGNVIIEEGAQIDDRAIDEAKAKGKLVELVMNNRA